MNNLSAASELSELTVIAQPFVGIVLIIGIMSNFLLLMLICKAHQVSNNTNVYLFSLGLVYIMQSYTSFTLLTTLAAQQWIFGAGLCPINQVIFRITTVVTSAMFITMSHERYKTVKNPFAVGKFKRQKSIAISIGVWILSVILAFPGTLYQSVAGSSEVAWNNCLVVNSPYYLKTQVPIFNLDYLYSAIIPLCSVVSLAYYVLIYRALNEISTYRLRCEMFRVSLLFINSTSANRKPIQYSTEKQTARSLRTFILFQLACSAITSIMVLIVFGIEELDITHDLTTHQMLYIVGLFFYILPTINPFLLFLTNKRYKNRVKHLILKCSFLPELANDNVNVRIRTNRVAPTPG